MIRIIGERPEDLLPKHADAYDALPEPYQNDSCLLFWVVEETDSMNPDMEIENLYCGPLESEVFALGNWICRFIPANGPTNAQWVEVEKGIVII